MLHFLPFSQYQLYASEVSSFMIFLHETLWQSPYGFYISDRKYVLCGLLAMNYIELYQEELRIGRTAIPRRSISLFLMALPFGYSSPRFRLTSLPREYLIGATLQSFQTAFNVTNYESSLNLSKACQNG